MIRMGKSSKVKEAEAVPKTLEPLDQPAVSLTSDSRGAAAFSESELMARDIKEGRLSGFVGSGTVLTGETSFESMLRVDGHLKGQISSENGTLIIGSTGQVDADIVVVSAVINGAVNGDIVVSDKLTLGRSARVIGNVHTPSLIIEDGATLEGNCSMLEPKEAGKNRIAKNQTPVSTIDLEFVKDNKPDLSTKSSEDEKTDKPNDDENANIATV